MRQAKVEIGDGTATLRLAFTDWGPPAADRTVVCVHGLTRNGRDFDVLAERLSRKARVLCFDVAGRGGSDWLVDPLRYAVPIYCQHLRLTLRRLGVEACDWVGTSMGGLIGMGLAPLPGSPVRRLVLNDVGPLVPKSALELIGRYLGLDISFPDLAALEAHLRQIHAPFGPLTDAQWRHLAFHSARTDGSVWRLHYDPRIRQPFVGAGLADIEIWPVYDAIACPTLLIRGADSLLLSAETAEAMTGRGPKAKLVTFTGAGHAPALMADDQVEAIAGWLGL
ncbi:MAG TPA: alpha/beta hydrolase [Geminicoccaceae bacterium]|nr:alpha/beta hydrolase [Geminicoccus sp.]HMU50155.1 alpha/beta hydrolase [Geminicoccaceae bacterium]